MNRTRNHGQQRIRVAIILRLEMTATQLLVRVGPVLAGLAAAWYLR
jgi:hypothetical protein